MPKRKLALILYASMSAIVVLLLITAVAMVLAHRSPLPLLGGALATMPGFVIATLAWRGKLPDCRSSPSGL